MKPIVPVALFAYARPDHLRQTLEGLRANNVTLIYAFSDGPLTADKAPSVAEVRAILHSIDWCKVVVCEREKNLGLGRSIMTGVSSVLDKHDNVIVFEDDLVCMPGTYRYLSTALHVYRNDSVVMSVTGWTHPSVTPNDVHDHPYFDGRAECLVWGTWAKAWRGMGRDAKALMQACKANGIDPYHYGADLLSMAEGELKRNIWAVRFLYLHILNRRLCLRPPHSMVEHIGFDALATNAGDGSQWSNPPLKACPLLPDEWPAPVENPQCPHLWQKACGGKPVKPLAAARIRRAAARILQKIQSKVTSRLGARIVR